MKKYQGITLIELMVVLIIISIIAAIAFPSYRSYVERKDLALAKQTALNLATELEKFKSKNFSYKGFDVAHIYPNYVKATGELYVPVDSTSISAKYKITLVDIPTKKSLADTGNDVLGLNWAMKLEREKEAGSSDLKQPRNYDLLITSTGMRCMTRTTDVVKDYTDCEGDYENW